MKEDLLKGLTPEQIEKVRACKSHEELLEVAKKEGVELNEDQLEAISGGACEPQRPADTVCPQCGSSNTSVGDWDISDTRVECRCLDCGCVFHPVLTRKWQ